MRRNLLALTASVAVLLGVFAASPASADPQDGEGTVAGKVTGTGGVELANICVSIDGGASTSDQTDADGNYSISDLTVPGQVDLLFWDCDNGNAGRVTTNKPYQPVAANDIVLTEDTVTKNVPMVLGSTVRGRVWHENTANPAQGCVRVNAFVEGDHGFFDAQPHLAWAEAAGNGQFVLAGAPTNVPMALQIVDCDAPEGDASHYKTEWWSNEKTSADALPIVLAAGGLRTGVDVRMSTLEDSPTGSNCTVEPFPDVKNNNPFCDDIYWMAELDLTGGYSDGQYKSANPVSRQAMAAFLYRFVEGGDPEDTDCDTKPFSDVPRSSEFCAHIEWLVDQGIAEGYDDGTFKPTAPITRQAMAAFLHRIDQEAINACSAHFADVPITHDFFDDIQWMFQSGVSTGTAQQTGKPLYKPADNVSRQAMAAFIHRLWNHDGNLTGCGA